MKKILLPLLTITFLFSLLTVQAFAYSYTVLSSSTDGNDKETSVKAVTGDDTLEQMAKYNPTWTFEDESGVDSFSLTTTADSEGKAGTWTYTGPDGEAQNGEVWYVTVKGSNGYKTYKIVFEGGEKFSSLSDDWSTEGLLTPGKKHQETPAASHITFWRSSTSPVPIPGAVWLLGSGIMGLLGIGVRSKKKHS